MGRRWEIMSTLIMKELELWAEKLDFDPEAKGDTSSLRAREAHVEGWEFNARVEEGWWVALGGEEGGG